MYLIVHAVQEIMSLIMHHNREEFVGNYQSLVIRHHYRLNASPLFTFPFKALFFAERTQKLHSRFPAAYKSRLPFTKMKTEAARKLEQTRRSFVKTTFLFSSTYFRVVVRRFVQRRCRKPAGKINKLCLNSPSQTKLFMDQHY